jgi:hypothetical protein
MKLFAHREIREARAYAEAGGQALHAWDPPRDEQGRNNWPGAPTCFRRSGQWGHLFDMDTDRLIATARRLGVRAIMIHGQGARQHVDLCGQPLAKAIRECGGQS